MRTSSPYLVELGFCRAEHVVAALPVLPVSILLLNFQFELAGQFARQRAGGLGHQHREFAFWPSP